MMFVSVLSTSAFADKSNIISHPDIDTLPLAPEQSATANKNAISHAKANIEYMYGALAADNAVFSTVKAMDSFISDVTEELFKDVDTVTVGALPTIAGKTLQDNTKIVMRDYFGSEIVRYMSDHRDSYAKRSRSLSVGGNKLSYTGFTDAAGSYIYTDAAGNVYGYEPTGDNWFQAPAGTSVQQARVNNPATVGWVQIANPVLTQTWEYDPIKYANTFATAASKAFTDKEGAAALEALMYQLYSLKVLDSVNDDLNDLFDDVAEWEDGTAILSQYHFHDLTDGVLDFDLHGIRQPYAFLSEFNYPNALELPDAIFAPDLP